MHFRTSLIADEVKAVPSGLAKTFMRRMSPEVTA